MNFYFFRYQIVNIMAADDKQPMYWPSFPVLFLCTPEGLIMVNRITVSIYLEIKHLFTICHKTTQKTILEIRKGTCKPFTIYPIKSKYVSKSVALDKLPVTPGSAFIKPDQLDPWIKDQIKITLLPTISHLQLPNFVSCGRACPSHMTQNLVTVGAKLWTTEHFLVDPWSMYYADPVW